MAASSQSMAQDETQQQVLQQPIVYSEPTYLLPEATSAFLSRSLASYYHIPKDLGAVGGAEDRLVGLNPKRTGTTTTTTTTSSSPSGEPISGELSEQTLLALNYLLDELLHIILHHAAATFGASHQTRSGSPYGGGPPKLVLSGFGGVESQSSSATSTSGSGGLPTIEILTTQRIKSTLFKSIGSNLGKDVVLEAEMALTELFKIDSSWRNDPSLPTSSSSSSKENHIPGSMRKASSGIINLPAFQEDEEEEEEGEGKVGVEESKESHGNQEGVTAISSLDNEANTNGVTNNSNKKPISGTIGAKESSQAAEEIFDSLRSWVMSISGLGAACPPSGPSPLLFHLQLLLPPLSPPQPASPSLTFVSALYTERCLTFIAEYLINAIAKVLNERAREESYTTPTLGTNSPKVSSMSGGGGASSSSNVSKGSNDGNHHPEIRNHNSGTSSKALIAELSDLERALKEDDDKLWNWARGMRVRKWIEEEISAVHEVGPVTTTTTAPSTTFDPINHSGTSAMGAHNDELVNGDVNDPLPYTRLPGSSTGHDSEAIALGGIGGLVAGVGALRATDASASDTLPSGMSSTNGDSMRSPKSSFLSSFRGGGNVSSSTTTLPSTATGNASGILGSIKNMGRKSSFNASNSDLPVGFQSEGGGLGAVSSNQTRKDSFSSIAASKLASIVGGSNGNGSSQRLPDDTSNSSKGFGILPRNSYDTTNQSYTPSIASTAVGSYAAGSGIGNSREGLLGTNVNSTPGSGSKSINSSTARASAGDEFELLMQSGKTMKVSLTPDRLRTMEKLERSRALQQEQLQQLTPTTSRQRDRTPSMSGSISMPSLSSLSPAAYLSGRKSAAGSNRNSMIFQTSSPPLSTVSPQRSASKPGKRLVPRKAITDALDEEDDDDENEDEEKKALQRGSDGEREEGLERQKRPKETMMDLLNTPPPWSNKSVEPTKQIQTAPQVLESKAGVPSLGATLPAVSSGHPLPLTPVATPPTTPIQGGTAVTSAAMERSASRGSQRSATSFLSSASEGMKNYEAKPLAKQIKAKDERVDAGRERQINYDLADFFSSNPPLPTNTSPAPPLRMIPGIIKGGGSGAPLSELRSSPKSKTGLKGFMNKMAGVGKSSPSLKGNDYFRPEMKELGRSPSIASTNTGTLRQFSPKDKLLRTDSTASSRQHPTSPRDSTYQDPMRNMSPAERVSYSPIIPANPRMGGGVVSSPVQLYTERRRDAELSNTAAAPPKTPSPVEGVSSYPATPVTTVASATTYAPAIAAPSVNSAIGKTEQENMDTVASETTSGIVPVSPIPLRRSSLITETSTGVFSPIGSPLPSPSLSAGPSAINRLRSGSTGSSRPGSRNSSLRKAPPSLSTVGTATAGGAAALAATIVVVGGTSRIQTPTEDRPSAFAPATMPPAISEVADNESMASGSPAFKEAILAPPISLITPAAVTNASGIAHQPIPVTANASEPIRKNDLASIAPLPSVVPEPLQTKSETLTMDDLRARMALASSPEEMRSLLDRFMTLQTMSTPPASATEKDSLHAVAPAMKSAREPDVDALNSSKVGRFPSGNATTAVVTEDLPKEVIPLKGSPLSAVPMVSAGGGTATDSSTDELLSHDHQEAPLIDSYRHLKQPEAQAGADDGKVAAGSLLAEKSNTSDLVSPGSEEKAVVKIPGGYSD